MSQKTQSLPNCPHCGKPCEEMLFRCNCIADNYWCVKCRPCDAHMHLPGYTPNLPIKANPTK